ncbi:MAG TPA: hypothetical protein VFN10_16600 [Thermoanaerobaculia bacterium]|nr:hypothetical protein [Thermoanaerobaculia bacterium]
MRMRVMFAVAVLSLAALSVAAAGRDGERQLAVAPTIVPLSGELLTAAGAPRSGAVRLVVTIYASRDSNEPLWSEEQQADVDASGHYSIKLGSATEGGIPRDVFHESDGRWIGIAEKNDLEQPRFLIVSVPYAARAYEAETVGGKSASDFVLADELKDRVMSVLTAGPGDKVTFGVPNAFNGMLARPALKPKTDTVLPVLAAGAFIHAATTGQTIGALGRAVSTSPGNGLFGGVTGVQGEVTPTQAGGYSAGVRGVNNGTSGSGIGVAGYQAGSGWGVAGETPSGFGVYGVTTNSTADSAGVRGDTLSSVGAGVVARYGGNGMGTALEVDNGAIRITGTNRAAFIHTATDANKFDANGTDIDNAMCNNDPNALLFVTQRYSNVYNNSPIGVFYNPTRFRWEIFNENNTAIPTNAQFNVLVIKQN